MPELALATLAVLLGAFAQSATGFGMSAVAAPALFLMMEPAEAVTALAALGVVVSLMTLFGERRPRRILWSELAPMLAAGLPGIVLGALLLRALPKAVLQVVVGAAVIASVGVRLAGPRGSRPRAVRRGTYAVGLVSGALTTSTNLNGPPLVAWLLMRGAAPDELRDTVTGGLLLLNVVAIPVLALLGLLRTGSVGGLVALLVVAAIGQRLGRLAFERLDTARYEAVLLVGLVGAGAASVAAGVY